MYLYDQSTNGHISICSWKGCSMLYYRLFCNRWCNLEEKKWEQLFIYLFSYEPLSAIMFSSFCINMYLTYTKSIQLNFNRKNHHKTVATSKIWTKENSINFYVHVFTEDWLQAHLLQVAFVQPQARSNTTS